MSADETHAAPCQLAAYQPSSCTRAFSRSAVPAQDTVYLDHAASTPMYPEAIAAMTEQLATVGNPSSYLALSSAAWMAVSIPSSSCFSL